MGPGGYGARDAGSRGLPHRAVVTSTAWPDCVRAGSPTSGVGTMNSFALEPSFEEAP